MNVHDKARKLVAQSPRPMELSEAYRILGQRRRKLFTAKPRLTSEVDFSKIRLPYAD